MKGFSCDTQHKCNNSAETIQNLTALYIVSLWWVLLCWTSFWWVSYDECHNTECCCVECRGAKTLPFKACPLGWVFSTLPTNFLRKLLQCQVPPLSWGQPFSPLLSGGIWTLHLKFMSRIFYHCWNKQMPTGLCVASFLADNIHPFELKTIIIMEQLKSKQ
jgi:hypothetical protein